MAAVPFIQVLGPLAVRTDDAPAQLGPPQRHGLLAVLLVHQDSAVSLDQLTAQLWGGRPPASARAQIQNHISALRKAFGGGPGGPLRTQHPGYWLDAAAEDRDDVRFRAEVAEARVLAASGDAEAAQALFRRALDRWRGPAYDGVDLPVVRAVASELDELRVDVLEDWAAVALAVGAASDVAEALAAELARHPLRERLRALLMQALTATGRRADALRVYREGHAVLVEELGVEPGADLQSLHQELLNDDTPPVPDAAPVLLPPRLADFTGRAGLVDECARGLVGGTTMCLCGQAGIGKTALAVELAHRCAEDFPGGRILARLSDAPRAVDRALAGCLRALGVSAAAMPDELDERSTLLRERLADRAVLIVLDGANCEQQVRPFLPDAGRSVLLVTSRHRLDGIDGILHVELPLLSEPDALQLLKRVVGATRIRADPDAARELVRYCDRLPLALWIAAARLAGRPSWAVGDLVARLAEERNRLDWLQIGDRAVRTTFSATCAQLAAAERALFRRLAALPVREFPGWVAAALVDLQFERADLLLDRLVEEHLVEAAGRDPTGQRYHMHDLLRLFGRELADAEEPSRERAAALSRAYDGWLALAQSAGDAQPGWIARDPEPAPRWSPPPAVRSAVARDPSGWFEAEYGAALAVIRSCAELRLSRIGWPLAQRLVGFFDRTNRVDDWQLACESGLAAAERAGDVAGQACMHRFLAESQRIRGNLDDALRSGEVARDLYAAFDPNRGVAAAGVRLATAHQVLGELDVAAELGTAAISAARRIGEPTLVGNALHVTASICSYRGDLHTALALFQEAGAAYTDARCSQGQAAAHGSIGLVLKRLGRFQEAQAALSAARGAAGVIGDLSMCGHFDSYLAEVLAALGEHEAALNLAAAAVRTQQESGDRHAQAVALTALAVVTEPAQGPAAAVPVLEAAVRAWRAAGVSPAAALRQLVGACRGAGDEERAQRFAADLEQAERGD